MRIIISLVLGAIMLNKSLHAESHGKNSGRAANYEKNLSMDDSMGWEKSEQQQEERKKIPRALRRSQAMGWEKDQRPFVPIKTSRDEKNEINEI
jgi:hypothetical protein